VICCIEEFVQEISKEINKLSPEEKLEFRQPWLDYVAEKEQMRRNDRRFLKSCGIDPDGD
jgi:hypothetical protein